MADEKQENHGLYNVIVTPSGRFRMWQSTGTMECMVDGVWKSIPEPAQAEIIRLTAVVEDEK